MSKIITFEHHPAEGEEKKPDMEVGVHDLYPQLPPETYVDGRYVMMFSVEASIDLLAHEGFYPVVPTSPTRQTLELL